MTKILTTDMKSPSHNPTDTKGAKNSLHEGQRFGCFRLLRKEDLSELGSIGYEFVHEPSSARLIWIANDDTNRSFAIAFKTPPTDDTGVFHIIEHSVLCGSKKYSVKEPFVNLLKTSMHTFLNALTFSDKTMYPVASTNVLDLENLMDVYLDAVFHPQMYQKPSIFQQEGWHLELEKRTSPLRINGVVYNEMKGALSDPEDVLYVEAKRALFPDNAYAFESGGNPEAIATLDFEAFLDAHNRHYQLKNSYTVLYGDLDIERELAFLEKRFQNAMPEVLEKERRRPAGIPNKLGPQASVTQQTVYHQMPTAEENRTVGLAYVADAAGERERLLATSILLEALFGSNEAPLKKALLARNLGSDVSAELIDDQQTPFILVQLHGASEGAETAFKEAFEEEVARILENGIDTNRLEAALAQTTFAFREQDFGHYPAGVALSMAALGTWLYDKDGAFVNLHFEKELADLARSLGLGVFEKLLARLFVENPHKASIVIEPVAEEASSAESAFLAQKKKALRDEDLDTIIAATANLHALQAAPDDPADLEKLPTLTVADIAPAPPSVDGAPLAIQDMKGVFYDIDTHNISYMNAYFSLSRFSYDDLFYLGLLALLLGKLDTRAHTAAELDTLLGTNLGDLSFEIAAFPQHRAPQKEIAPRFVVSASALAENTSELATLPFEVACQTLFEDHEKIQALLGQQKLAAEQAMVESGHAIARARSRSYFSVADLFIQRIDGIDFYRFICDIYERWQTCAEEVCARLERLQKRLFVIDGTEISFAGAKTDCKRFCEAATATKTCFGLAEGEASLKTRLQMPAPTVLNEGFIVPANVCYAGACLPLTANDPSGLFSGSWLVSARAITYDYLWNEVRVKGGAYGAGFSADASNLACFYSYRDPAIDPTLKRFEKTGAWLFAFSPTQQDVDGFIVATIAAIDNPKKPKQIMTSKDHLRFCGFPQTWEEQVRQEVLSCDKGALTRLASKLENLKTRGGFCVIGGPEFFEKSKAHLSVSPLIASSANAKANGSSEESAPHKDSPKAPSKK